jgi:crotonobetainyl-CoA:carnitine CoA-transferase CaiB-like acyl-CoA transferase
MVPINERIARAAEFDDRVSAWTETREREAVLAVMRELAIPAGVVREPREAVDLIRAQRPGAVSLRLTTGEHVPSFPALFDGERIARTPAPVVGGPRRYREDRSPEMPA